MSHSIITRGPTITDSRASPILDGQSTITLCDVMSYGPVICAISSFLTIRDCLSLSETSNETKDLVDPVIGGKLIDKAREGTLKIASTWANRDVIGYVMSYVPTFKGYEVPSRIVSKKHATEMKPVCFLDEDDYWYYEKEKKRENLEHLEDEYDGYHH